MDDRIVVGVDGSPGSLRALRWAIDDAAARGGVIEAVTAWQSPYDFGEEPLVPALEEQISADAASSLHDGVVEVAGAGVPCPVREVVVHGDPAWSLCDRAAGASALVVGSRGHGGLSGALLGSVSTKCAHHCSSPVVIVPAEWDVPVGGGRRPGRIVVGVDLSAGSRRALAWALDEARGRGWTVDVVEAWQDPYGGDMSVEFDIPHFRRERQAMVEAAEERLKAFVEQVVGPDPPVPVTPVMVEGEAAAALCAGSEGADLLVVGSRGRGGFARLLLGSVSTSCAHHSRCPVAIVPDGRSGHI